MQDERTHSLSQKNLLGENASSQLKDEWSLENHVTKTAPISFLCCAINDKSVNPEGNIIPYWQALRKNGVKTEQNKRADAAMRPPSSVHTMFTGSNHG